MRLLGVVAAVVDVGVGESGAPHHDAAEAGVALVLADETGKLGGCDVVSGAAGAAVGRQRSGRHANEDLGIGRLGGGREANPLVVVEGSVAVKRQSTGVGIVVVVVELHKEVVKDGVLDDRTHVRLRDRALRRAGDIVRMGGVRSKLGAQLRDHGGIVGSAGADLDVKVESVYEVVAERSLNGGVARIAVRVPEVGGNLLCLGVRRQGV